jgi:hypothetical protein
MNPVVTVVVKFPLCTSKLASSTANCPIGLFPLVILFLVVFFSSVVWVSLDLWSKILSLFRRRGAEFLRVIDFSDRSIFRQLEIIQFVRLGQYVVPVPVSTPYPANTNSCEFCSKLRST